MSIKETNESEPLMKCRNSKGEIKPVLAQKTGGLWSRLVDFLFHLIPGVYCGRNPIHSNGVNTKAKSSRVHTVVALYPLGIRMCVTAAVQSSAASDVFPGAGRRGLPLLVDRFSITTS